MVAPHANAFSSSVADKKQTNKVGIEIWQCRAMLITANRLIITENEDNEMKTTIMAVLLLSLYMSVGRVVVSADIGKYLRNLATFLSR